MEKNVKYMIYVIIELQMLQYALRVAQHIEIH